MYRTAEDNVQQQNSAAELTWLGTMVDKLLDGFLKVMSELAHEQNKHTHAKTEQERIPILEKWIEMFVRVLFLTEQLYEAARLKLVEKLVCSGCTLSFDHINILSTLVAFIGAEEITIRTNQGPFRSNDRWMIEQVWDSFGGGLRFHNSMLQFGYCYLDNLQKYSFTATLKGNKEQWNTVTDVSEVQSASLREGLACLKADKREDSHLLELEKENSLESRPLDSAFVRASVVPVELVQTLHYFYLRFRFFFLSPRIGKAQPYDLDKHTIELLEKLFGAFDMDDAKHTGHVLCRNLFGKTISWKTAVNNGLGLLPLKQMIEQESLMQSSLDCFTTTDRLEFCRALLYNHYLPKQYSGNVQKLAATILLKLVEIITRSDLESSRKRCSGSDTVQQTLGNNRNDIVKTDSFMVCVFQELISHMDSASATSGDKIWLLEVARRKIHSIHKRHPKDTATSATNTFLSAYFVVVGSISPLLFWSNCFSLDGICLSAFEQNLNNIRRFIDDHMKDFTISSTVSSYLFCGLAQAIARVIPSSQNSLLPIISVRHPRPSHSISCNVTCIYHSIGLP